MDHGLLTSLQAEKRARKPGCQFAGNGLANINSWGIEEQPGDASICPRRLTVPRKAEIDRGNCLFRPKCREETDQVYGWPNRSGQVRVVHAAIPSKSGLIGSFMV